jgi:hypothetical protein
MLIVVRLPDSLDETVRRATRIAGYASPAELARVALIGEVNRIARRKRIVARARARAKQRATQSNKEKSDGNREGRDQPHRS